MKTLAMIMALSMMAPAAFAKTEQRDLRGDIKWLFCISMYQPPATERVFGQKQKPSDIMSLKVTTLDSEGQWQTNVLPVTQMTEIPSVTTANYSNLVVKAANGTVTADLFVGDMGEAKLSINGVPQDYLKMGCTYNTFSN